MFIGVVTLGTDYAPPGPPDPTIRLQAGTGAAVAVSAAHPVAVPDGLGAQIALATVTDDADDVHLVQVEVLRPGNSWQIQFDNTDTAAARRFTWVVADTAAEARQPWIDAPTELALEADVSGEAVTRPLRIANRGTGPLRIDDADGLALGMGVVLTAVPDVIAPNACADARITFSGSDTPGTQTAVWSITANDSTARQAAGHNHRVAVVATTRQKPLWQTGDILVLDPSVRADPPGGRGGLIRVDPRTGTQTVVSSGDLLAWPVGLAVEADGNVVIADREAFGDATTARGGLVRVDRQTGKQSKVSAGGLVQSPSRVAVTGAGDLLVVDGARILRITAAGAQTVVSSGNLLVTPQGMVIEGDGRLLVVDGSAFDRTGGLIRVDPTTGAQTTVTSGGLLRRPVGVALEADGGVLVVDRDAAHTSTVIRVSPDQGAQQGVAVGGVLADPVGLAVEADGSIVVVDTAAFGGAGGVVRVDPRDGQQTAVASGGSFQRPFGIAVVRAG
jgi:hypothetical protein